MRRTILPGFGLTLGFTVCYLSLLVLLPLAATFEQSAKLGWHAFWQIATAPRAVAAYELSFGASLRRRGDQLRYGDVGRVGARPVHSFRCIASSTRSWTCRLHCRRPLRA